MRFQKRDPNPGEDARYEMSTPWWRAESVFLTTGTGYRFCRSQIYRNSDAEPFIVTTSGRSGDDEKDLDGATRAMTAALYERRKLEDDIHRELVPKHDTPATVRRAFDKTGDTVMTETGSPENVNMSDIFTRIIQDVGRFAERYASDALYTIRTIDGLCRSAWTSREPVDEIFVFGIRASGVDGNAYFMSKLFDTRSDFMEYVHPEQVYRRVLAPRVRIGMLPLFDGGTELHPRVICELKDLTHSFLRIDPADLDGNGRLVLGPYEDGNPEPAEPVIKQNGKRDVREVAADGT